MPIEFSKFKNEVVQTYKSDYWDLIQNIDSIIFEEFSKQYRVNQNHYSFTISLNTLMSEMKPISAFDLNNITDIIENTYAQNNYKLNMRAKPKRDENNKYNGYIYDINIYVSSSDK